MMTEKVVNLNSKFQKLKGEKRRLCYLFLKSHCFKDNPITHARIFNRGNGVGLEAIQKIRSDILTQAGAPSFPLSSLRRDCRGAWPPHSDICANLCCKSSLHDL